MPRLQRPATCAGSCVAEDPSWSISRDGLKRRWTAPGNRSFSFKRPLSLHALSPSLIPIESEVADNLVIARDLMDIIVGCLAWNRDHRREVGDCLTRPIERFNSTVEQCRNLRAPRSLRH